MGVTGAMGSTDEGQGAEVVREDVEFRSSGDTCAGWLYLPAGEEPAPVIVMGHGLGAVRTMGLDRFAQRFVAAGYACMVFDYRFFGDSTGEPRQLLSVARQLEDWRAAIAFASAEPRVDGSRVLVWGSSFGGGHALTLAAEMPTLAGAIAQCPFTSGIHSSLALHPLSSLKMGPTLAADLLAKVRGADPVLAPLTAEPGGRGLMTAADAKPGYGRLLEEGGNPPDKVAARVVLDIMTYNPARKAASIKVPTLVVATMKDTVAPVGPTLRAAAKIPNGELVKLDAGHFDIYAGDWYEKNMSAQLDWLARTVPVS